MKTIATQIAEHWEEKHCYQSIFFEGEEIVRGVNRQDISSRIDAIHSEDIIGKRVLDLGCNHGHTAMMVAERGATQVVGLDVRLDLIAYARWAAGLLELPCDFIQHDLSAPYENGLFDTILCLAIYDAVLITKLLETIESAAPSVVYFEGHRKGNMPEQEYRALYKSFLGHFIHLEMVYSAPMRYMYRCT